MRVAPPVQALSCGAGAWRALQQALYALSATVAALWGLGHWQGMHTSGVLASLCLGFGVAWLSGRRLAPINVTLLWDGAVWFMQAPGGARQAGRARLMLDLGHWMLVCFVADSGSDPGKATWLPLRRADAPAAWRGMRVALYATQQDSTATQPPARPRRAA